jgi:tetrahydromethanopterin S-methyltransferase subunit G
MNDSLQIGNEKSNKCDHASSSFGTCVKSAKLLDKLLYHDSSGKNKIAFAKYSYKNKADHILFVFDVQSVHNKAEEAHTFFHFVNDFNIKDGQNAYLAYLDNEKKRKLKERIETIKKIIDELESKVAKLKNLLQEAISCLDNNNFSGCEAKLNEIESLIADLIAEMKQNKGRKK